MELTLLENINQLFNVEGLMKTTAFEITVDDPVTGKPAWPSPDLMNAITFTHNPGNDLQVLFDFDTPNIKEVFNLKLNVIVFGCLDNIGEEIINKGY